MPRWYRYDLLSSANRDPQVIKIQHPSRYPGQVRPPIFTRQRLNDDNPFDIRYSQNINITSSAWDPRCDRSPNRYCPRKVATMSSQPIADNIDPSTRRFDRHHVDEQDQSNHFDSAHCQIHDRSSCRCYRDNHYPIPGERECSNIAPRQTTFLYAYRYLRGTVLNTSQYLEGLYVKFVEDIRNRRHISKNDQRRIWRQRAIETEEFHLSPDNRYPLRSRTPAMEVHDHSRFGNLDWRHDVSVKDVRQELSDCFNKFEHCLDRNMTQGYGFRSNAINPTAYSEERSSQRLKDTYRLHRKVTEDIDQIRPLLGRIRYDQDVVRSVICDLSVILERLDGFWKFWGEDLQDEQRYHRTMHERSYDRRRVSPGWSR